MNRPSSILLLSLLMACDGCGDEGSSPTNSPTSESLLDVDGDLPAGVARGVDFEVEVTAGSNLTVSVVSTAFDPVLAVRPPGAGVLTNDDWQGSREESRIAVVPPESGTMKITVTSFQPEAAGAFHVHVEATRAAGGVVPLATATVVPSGGEIQGQLGPGDLTLPDGRFKQTLLLAGAESGPLELHLIAGTDAIPTAIVMDPRGRGLSPSGGGRYAIVEPGPHHLQLLSPGPGVAASYSLTLRPAGVDAATPTLTRGHHQLPQSAGTMPLAIGQTVQGALAPTDGTLPTGEPADVYTVLGTAGQSLHAELRASEFDAYLILIGPSGRYWENDDSGGGTDSTLDVALPTSGAYRLVTTAYRAGESGAYELKLSSGGQAALAAVANPPAQPGQQRSIEGALAPGDATLNSGEFADTHEITCTAGERVHLEAHSTQFDTYLIVKPPTGNQLDNDDAEEGNTDSGLDFVAQSAGIHRVIVTSYRAGETGTYTLVVGGTSGSPATPTPTPSPTPAVAATGPSVTGTLAAGDPRLGDGEFSDVLTRTFTTGEAVNIRLASSRFDPYLIVRSPSGHQMDNDDVDANTRDAEIRIPSAEAGEYTITVTSYRAGETGPYTLSFGAGAAVPRAGGTGGARVFGLFAGITDYPDGVGDLDECANDAIKLAEALRNRGLLDPSRQVLLTDAQATRANVTAGLRRLAAEMGPSDVFVFFYSGHGGQTRTTRDPREIDGTDEYLVLHDGQLLDDELARQFDAVRAGTSVIALDACFSGGFAKDMITRPGRVGLFSSEEDVLSAVASQFQAGGYLSHFLRTAVSGEADVAPNDRVLTVGELTHFLYTQFGTHATDVQLQGAYQHLVVDRGAVHVDQVLWSYQ